MKPLYFLGKPVADFELFSLSVILNFGMTLPLEFSMYLNVIHLKLPVVFRSFCCCFALISKYMVLNLLLTY